MILCRNTHRRVCGLGIRRTDRHSGRRLIDDIIRLAADGGCPGQCVTGKHLVDPILVLVEHKGRDILCRRTGKSDNRVSSDSCDIYIRAADSSCTVGRSGAKVRQPACVIGDGVIVLAVIVAGNNIIVEFKVYQIAIPVFAGLVILPCAGTGADGLRVALITVFQPSVVDSDINIADIGAGLGRLMGGGSTGRASSCKVDDAGAVAAGEVCAVLSGIELVGYVDGTVDVEFRIFQIISGTDRGRAVCGGLTGHNKLQVARAAVAAPVFGIIEVNRSVGGEGRAFVDCQLGAGQESDAVGLIACDRSRAGLNNDIHVVEREDIVLRIHRNRSDQRKTADFHRKIIQRHITVSGYL